MRIATRVTKGHIPIQIQSEILRGWQAPPALTGGGQAFALLPESPDDAGGEGDNSLERDWHEADLKRAIAVAEEADLRNYRVEIAPDGTISIIVGDQG